MASNAQDRRTLLLLLLAATVAALVVSGLDPYDRPTWLLEVLPVLVVIPLLFFTRNSYPLTTLLYVLIFVHALVLILGGAYTYARVPIGFTLQDLFGFERNPYDRVGHFLQGFVPAIAVREILVRGQLRAHAGHAQLHHGVHRAGDQRQLRVRRMGRCDRVRAGRA